MINAAKREIVPIWGNASAAPADFSDIGGVVAIRTTRCRRWYSTRGCSADFPPLPHRQNYRSRRPRRRIEQMVPKATVTLAQGAITPDAAVIGPVAQAALHETASRCSISSSSRSGFYKVNGVQPEGGGQIALEGWAEKANANTATFANLKITDPSQ
jgi:hypothetical protein